MFENMTISTSENSNITKTLDLQPSHTDRTVASFVDVNETWFSHKSCNLLEHMRKKPETKQTFIVTYLYEK